MESWKWGSGEGKENRFDDKVLFHLSCLCQKQDKNNVDFIIPVFFVCIFILDACCASCDH